MRRISASRGPRRRRRLAVVALAGALAASITVAATDPAPTVTAAPDDVIALVLHGTGNGHGRGMSQWGAYGYAVDHGWDWNQILDHYYGGTVAGTTTPGQRIKVRLTPYDGLGTVGVISHGAGVSWNGTTAPAMRAVETSPGVFDIFRGSAVACPTSTSISVPDGPVSKNPSTYNAAAASVQAFLKNFHDGSIVVDGYFGNQTDSVLSSWQTSVGLPVDGTRWDADDAARARSIISAAGGAVSWTKIGTHAQSVGSPVRFTAADGDNAATDRGDVLGVCSSSGSVTHYRGAIEVLSTSSGNRVVSDVLAEAYVRGVVPKEISASWAAAGDGAGVHAVRAQAVAARTYGLHQSRNYTYDGSSTRYATTCDTTACQVYAGSATRASATGSVTRVEQDATDAAILATANVVRKWPDGTLVSTEFSASNGPRTAGGQFPPVDDIGDDTAPNPLHRWTRILDADDFAAQHGLGRITRAYMAETSSSQYQGFDGIWFDDLVVEGTNGTFRQQAWNFRNAYSLTSPGFTVEVITRSTTSTSFAMIGDSVGNSIAHEGGSEFRRLTDGTFASSRLDVVDGRCTTKTVCPGTTGVEAAASLPLDLDLVLVELGYNDTPANFASDIDAMMTALQARGVRRVAWVNMADIRTSNGQLVYTQANAALDAATARWPQLTVLDWEAASDTPERPRWFSDGVHLTTTGQAQFALWLRSQLLELAPSHYLAPPARIELPVVGETLTAPDGTELTIPATATGVALNVAVVRPSSNGFGTVWPCQDERPVVASVNFAAGAVLSNSVIAPISSDGTVCLYSSVGTNIVVDVAGWFTGSTTEDGADPFVGLLPDRRIDTRTGIGGATVKVTPSTPIEIPLAGTAATLPDGTATTVPADAAAAALNVAVVRAESRGFITLWPCGTTMPVAANVNYEAGAVVSNGVVAPIGANGSVCLHSSATADVVVDLNGYFDGSVAAIADESLVLEAALGTPAFSPATPTRIVDTRTATAAAALVRPATPLVVDVHGAELVNPSSGAPLVVPESASAVALNLAVVKPTSNGFGTVWPCSEAMPTAANINFRQGENISNGVVAPIGDDGSICVHLSNPANVVIDVAGWFRGGDDASFVGAVPERFVDTRVALGPLPS
ncbi:MAG: SpoIID/LytB domain-containing protein [Ilumatobacter sp.]|uniref:SpoIID/LytB domain-containing protein n=1 Tax=Ilumatobacter sp. TaxID=1967498 RepID=UPI00391BF621